MEKQTYLYDAFISYRHLPLDKMVAVRLQQLLENLKTVEVTEGKKTKRQIRVFRDQSELPTSGDLGGDIRSALEQSRFLIVICSEALKESRWCMEEINIFRKLHGESNACILPLLISGEPEESFPDLLKRERRTAAGPDGTEEMVEVEVEPLGADIRAETDKKRMHLLKTEYLRIAAPVLGCGFDDLYQRRQRRKRRQASTAAAAVLLAAVGFSAYSIYMLNRISEKQMELYANESLRLASLAEQQREDGDYRLAMLLAEAAMPEDLASPERPLVKEAETALRSAVTGQLAAGQKDVVSLQARMSFNVASWIICGTYAGGTRVAVTDYDNTYLYDTGTGKLLFSCSGHEVYFDKEAERAVRVSNLRGLEEEGGTVIEGFMTGTGERYFTGTYSKDGDPHMLYFGMPDDETGDCYIIRVQHDEELGGQAFTVADRFDDKGKSCGPEEIPADVEERCRNSYQYSYFDTRFSDYLKDVDYIPGKKEPEELEEAGFLTEILEEAGFNVQGAAATDDGELLILKVYQEGGGSYKGHQETINTILWSRKDSKPLTALNGICFLDRDTNLLYLKTYTELNIFAYHPENFDLEMESHQYYNRVSRDGKKYMALDFETSAAEVKSGWLRIFSIQDLKNPLLEAAIAAYPGRDKYMYFMSPDMEEVFLETADGAFELWKTQGECLLRFEDDEEEDAECVAFDPAQELLAIAYGDWNTPRRIEVRSAQDGELRKVIDFDVYDGGGISHMEFHGSLLLACTNAESVLFDLEGKEEARRFASGNQGYNQNYYLTEDGLLFCTQFTNSPYCLSAVYDTSTGRLVFGDTMARTYAYNEKTGILAYQEMNGVSNMSNSVHVARRGKEGIFIDSYTITSQKPNMMLRADGQSMDDRYLLVNGENCCEVYEVEKGRRVLSMEGYGYALADGKLYDMCIRGAESAPNYPVSDVRTLQEEAVGFLTSENGKRVLTEKEKEKYFIME